jgi:tRNA (mo5U34)-methyltransferase
MFDKDLALKLIQGKPWHHDFEILPGVRTNGAYNPTTLWNELQLPEDMSGLSLADVGASNGYFSFEARKRRARVVALDFRHKDNSGFGLVQYINGMSDIEHHQINVLDITREKYGQFDIVLALGLLYHVCDPYRALANCAALSRGRLLVESYCIDALLPKPMASEPIMRFISDPDRFPMHGQLNSDRSNFWGFTSVCMLRMVEDVNFSVLRKNVHGDRVFIDARRTSQDDGETRLSIAYGSVPVTLRGQNPDDSKAWKIF